jgi:hypothetical protein
MAAASRTQICVRGLATYAAANLARAYLARYMVAAVAVQAVVAEWGAGWVGVGWNDPRAAMPATNAIVRRAAIGGAIGLSAGAIAIGIAILTRGAHIATFSPAWTALPLGLIVVSLQAVRDELFLRGMTLRLVGEETPRALAIVACACAGAAGRFGSLGASGQSATPIEIAVAAILGASCGAIWIFDRGAWMASGAHAAWSFAMGPLVSGGLFDVRGNVGIWGGGDAGLEGAASVGVALILVSIAFGIWWRRSFRPTSDKLRSLS